MSGDVDPRLLSTAASVSDGTPVDWNDVRRQLDEEQSTILDELRLLEAFNRVNELAPREWGSFRITGEIGRGAFGTVYHAIDSDLQIDVALKLVQPSRSGAEVGIARALKEARLLAKVSHPNVVRIYRVESRGDEVGICMEFVRGRTLEEVVRQQAPYGPNEATLVGLDLCRALAAVHAAGLIHGDVKARNVMREAGGRTVLMDFGSGRLANSDRVESYDDRAGTPIYLAPEVFAGHPRSPSSDIYSLGVLLYFLVSGRYPVEGRTMTAIERHHWRGEPRKPLRDVRPDLPEGFVRVVEKAIAESPEERYRSAGAMEADLSAILPTRPAATESWSANPRRLWVAAAALVVLLVLGAGVWQMWRRVSEPAASGVIASAGANGAPSVASSPAVYQVDVGLYVERGGREVRVDAGTRVTPGDRLSMWVETSIPAFVYVVNEDERGESYLLFPLPGQAVSNPLGPGVRHRLPSGTSAPLSWQVTSAGGKEHFIVFVSPERSSAFEQMFASLPTPTFEQPAGGERLSSAGLGVLRGVGGLTTSSVPSAEQLHRVPEFATPLTGVAETARGVWVRQITLDNPSAAR